MAKDSTHPETRLKISRAEFSAKLRTQIEKGKELLLGHNGRYQELENLHRRFLSWDEFNKSLIARALTNQKEADNYDSGFFGNLGPPDREADMIAHDEDVSQQLRKLESLLERIELWDEVNPNHQSNAELNFWPAIHPEIVRVSKVRFESGQYADSAEAAMKEVNTQVKELYKTRTGIELDGTSLMKNAFSVSNPTLKLGDATDTGRAMQQGYMELFSGAMLAVRNPKAHANIVIDAKRGMHFLFLASLLMSKLEELLK